MNTLNSFHDDVDVLLIDLAVVHKRISSLVSPHFIKKMNFVHILF